VTISLEYRAFSVPSAFRRVSVDRLDIPPRLRSLLNKRGFSQLGDFDSLSHIEFRRYFRGFPSPTDVVLVVDRSIKSLVESLERSRPGPQAVALLPADIGVHDRERAPTLVASARDNSQSRIHELNDHGSVEQRVPIYIPVEHRGKPLAAYHPSVRLRNVCRHAGIRVLGQLNGRTLDDFGKLQNCGKKTVIELQQLIRRLQGVADIPQMHAATRRDSNVLDVNDSVRSLSLNELPTGLASAW
jgi:hypothetical protein